MFSPRLRRTLTTIFAFLVFPSLLSAAPAETAKPAQPDTQGDPLPEGAFARLGTGRLRHWGSKISAIAFSPDGSTLAPVAGETIRFWDPATGKETRRIDCNAPQFRFAWSP